MDTHISLIPKWAKAIEIQEGGKSTDRNIRNNNPGNLKWSSLTQGLGATSKDEYNFCIFPSYKSGFDALCQFLTLAAEDQLIPYKETRTLRTFTQKYANPPNSGYAERVAKALGVLPDIDISKLL